MFTKTFCLFVAIPVKISVPVPGTGEDGEPLYQTIRTMHQDINQAGSSRKRVDSSQDVMSREWEEESGPPTLPPPRNLSRAEESVAFFDYFVVLC